MQKAFQTTEPGWPQLQAPNPECGDLRGLEQDIKSWSTMPPCQLNVEWATTMIHHDPRLWYTMIQYDLLCYACVCRTISLSFSSPGQSLKPWHGFAGCGDEVPGPEKIMASTIHQDKSQFPKFVMFALQHASTSGWFFCLSNVMKSRTQRWRFLRTLCQKKRCAAGNLSWIQHECEPTNRKLIINLNYFVSMKEVPRIIEYVNISIYTYNLIWYKYIYIHIYYIWMIHIGLFYISSLCCKELLP